VNDKNYIKITTHAAELVPTAQFGNISIGPIGIVRHIEDTGIEDLKGKLREIQTICEEVVAEDRDSAHNLIRQSTEGRYQG
jgi:hypothetical protein